MATSLNINDFTYPLPSERIALYPLEQRDQSKLLVYRNGTITHERFFNLASYLPENSFLFFNNTKVIPARLHFTKDTGASIEIFLLHPVSPSPLLVETMQATSTCTWKCTIGNIKRWKTAQPLLHANPGINLRATLLDREEGMVQFTWDTSYTFAEAISRAGETPLPPYLKRQAEPQDRERYQTIYSKLEGAVAAPTAGLHFTPAVFETLQESNISTDFLTLHVSAGTFQPVKSENAAEHIMHQEQIIVTRSNIKHLLTNDPFIIPVGTTSMRTLESLYWYGALLSKDANAGFIVTQDTPHTVAHAPSSEIALKNVLSYMDRHQLDTIVGETSIYITPGYAFRLCKGLITNFHQPASTLILLVAAFIGKDWERVYAEALEHDYRFLSYGDSSLLLP